MELPILFSKQVFDAIKFDSPLDRRGNQFKNWLQPLLLSHGDKIQIESRHQAFSSLRSLIAKALAKTAGAFEVFYPFTEPAVTPLMMYLLRQI